MYGCSAWVYARLSAALQDRVNDNRLVSFRPHADQRRRRADQIFDPPHIALRVLWQIVEAAAVGGFLLPTGKLFIDWFRCLESEARTREGVDAAPVDVVGHTDLQHLKLIQHVQPSQRDAVASVEPNRVATGDRVEPAAASRPARGRAVFLSGFAQAIAFVVEQLGWHRSVADSRLVGL